jgi:hypothetical protein
MANYRKKPVVIQAEQFRMDAQVPPFYYEGNPVRLHERCDDPKAACSIDGKHYVETLEGPLVVSPGDYIIRGVKGEFYPCKPDIFEATYDKEPEPALGRIGDDIRQGSW